MIFKIAFRNLFRNVRRSLLTAGAVWIAVFILIFTGAFLKGFEESTVAVQIKTDTGLLRVAARNYFSQENEWSLDQTLKKEAEDFLQTFAEQFPRDKADPRVTFRADISDGQFTTRVRGVGINPDHFFQTFKMALTQGSLKASAESGNIPLWMGAALAKDFGAKAGDYFTLTARTRHGSYTANTFILQGIVEGGNPVVDFLSVYLPLAEAQTLLDMSAEITEIVVSGERRKKSRAFESWAAEHFPQLDRQNWVEESRPIREINTVRRKVIRILLGGILLIALSGIANTMLMACFERKKEIGMMKALGLSSSGLVSLILIEGVLIGILGAGLGFATAWPVVLWLEVHGINFGRFLEGSTSAAVSMASQIFFFPTAWLALRAFLTGVVVASLATLYPAWKFAKTHPLEALRG